MKFSIIMPVLNTSPRLLSKAIESVFDQTHTNWELIAVDGGSTNQDTKEVLRNKATGHREHGALYVYFLNESRGLQHDTDYGIAQATGDRICFLDSDDVLLQNALEAVEKFLIEHPDIGVTYSDETQIDVDGNPFTSQGSNKPEWNYEMFLQCMYTNHFKTFDAKLCKQVVAERAKEDYGTSQDWDLILRCVEHGAKIQRVPQILYAWRIHTGGQQFGNARILAHQYGKNAVTDHLKRMGQKNCKVLPTFDLGALKIKREASAPQDDKRTTVILLCHNNIGVLQQAVESFEAHGKGNLKHCNLKIVHGFENKSDKKQQEVAKYVSILPYEHTTIDIDFNYSKIMNMFMEKYKDESDYFIQMNDDIVLFPDALEEMVAFANMKPKAGIVGAKLLFPPPNTPTNPCMAIWTKSIGLIQHVGVDIPVCKHHGDYLVPTHVLHRQPSNVIMASVPRRWPAITFALVLIRKELFLQTKMDERFRWDLNDIDYCLQAGKFGWECWCNTNALAYHHESITRKPYGNCGVGHEYELFRRKWQGYEPNFKY